MVIKIAQIWVNTILERLTTDKSDEEVKQFEEIDRLYLEEAQDILNQILAIVEKIQSCTSNMWIPAYAMGLVLYELKSYQTAITYLQQARTLMSEQMGTTDERLDVINSIITQLMIPEGEAS